MLFTIIEKNTKQPIGICGLQKIDNNKKTLGINSLLDIFKKINQIKKSSFS